MFCNLVNLVIICFCGRLLDFFYQGHVLLLLGAMDPPGPIEPKSGTVSTVRSGKSFAVYSESW